MAPSASDLFDRAREASSLQQILFEGIGGSIFAFFIGIAMVVAWYRDERDTGNLLVGLPIDIPFIGETEEGED